MNDNDNKVIVLGTRPRSDPSPSDSYFVPDQIDEPGVTPLKPTPSNERIAALVTKALAPLARKMCSDDVVHVRVGYEIDMTLSYKGVHRKSYEDIPF